MNAGWLRNVGRYVRDYIPIGRISYAQEGEDLVLARIFEKVQPSLGAKGFFVDIGAHHPTRFSNTYYFYRRGWRGLNVDAQPGFARLFHRLRPHDVTVECGVGARSGVMTYFVFDEPALNTFSERDANERNRPPYAITHTLQVPVVTLAELLDRHLPAGVVIDFMTIDAEGLDEDIVASNDWNRYRPRLLLVELRDATIEDIADRATGRLLRRHGYRALAKTFNTFFFSAA